MQLEATTQEVLRLSEWTAASGIQQAQGSDRGGVWAWHDISNGERSFLYTEITGYFLTHACNLAQFSGDDVWLQRARNAARWICDVAMTESGLLLTRKYPRRGTNDPFDFIYRRVVFFDNCMAAYGLLRLGRVTGENCWLDAASGIAAAAAAAFTDRDNRLDCAVVDLSTGRPLANRDHWSLHPGSFHLKCAMLFEELDGIVPGCRYRELATGLLELSMTARCTDGSYLTSPVAGETHLHPLCYTIEGLLSLGHSRADSVLLEHATSALESIFSQMLMPPDRLEHVRPAANSYCGVRLRSDAVAQTIRAYYLACLLQPGWGGQFSAQAEQLHSALNCFELDGGTSYGLGENLRCVPHANAWCHFFRTEAAMLRDGLPGGAFQRAGGYYLT